MRERLFNELRNNLALRVEETDSSDRFIVSGRGELHLAILIETMRREGYEFQVSRPEVILRCGAYGKIQEPFEEVHIDTSQETVGAVVEMLGKRRGTMQNIRESGSGSVHLTFIVPTRGMLGFRYHLLTTTRGMATMNTVFHGYETMVGAISSRSRGSLVAWENGQNNHFRAQERRRTRHIIHYAGYRGLRRYGRRGAPTTRRSGCKRLQNQAPDQHAQFNPGYRKYALSPPRELSLDEAIEYLADDELLEITPQNIRIRKRILDFRHRGRQAKRTKKAAQSTLESQPC